LIISTESKSLGGIIETRVKLGRGKLHEERVKSRKMIMQAKKHFWGCIINTSLFSLTSTNYINSVDIRYQI